MLSATFVRELLGTFGRGQARNPADTRSAVFEIDVQSWRHFWKAPRSHQL